MELIDLLNWRYAVKKYSNRKVDEKHVNEIVDAINLSASSTGMQPYRLIVIDNEALKKDLGSDSFNAQITDASHLIVFAAFDTVTKERIVDFINYTTEARGVPVESMDAYKNSLETHLLARTDDENFNWSAKQAYIGLGTGLIAAANLGVDSTPMEGFNAERFDQVLGLKEKGLKSVVLLALGYRDEENDMYSKLKKVRLPQEEFALRVG